jgi:hypothetical protein
MKTRQLPPITLRQWVVGKIVIRTIMPTMTVKTQ